ncbi:MAG: hypothetical protein H6739_22205 [Alphaproteobacteria bacterium]|nr:hypothetical protein [Alphaproteobacteria bacterium]
MATETTSDAVETTLPTEVYPDLYDRYDNTTAEGSARNDARKRLYAAVLYLLKKRFYFDPDNRFMSINERPGGSFLYPTLTINLEPASFPGRPSDVTATQKIYFLAIYGRLLAENKGDPALGRSPLDPDGADDIILRDPTSAEPAKLRLVPSFVRSFVEAVERYHAHRELYEKVFSVLKRVGIAPLDVDGDSRPHSNIFSRQLTEVTDRLVEDRISHNAPQLGVRIEQAIGQAVGGSISGRASAVKVDLPDLDENLSVEILADNVRALSVLYFASELEDMRFFQVADKVSEQFQMGMLPLSRGPGGDNIFEYIKTATNRFTEIERLSMYARAFGKAQGGVDDALPNREFHNLWIRALSATSAYARMWTTAPVGTTLGSEGQLINLNVNTQQNRVHHMQVYKALRDLAVNLSLHGYGMAHFAAVELQQTIRVVKNMLSNPEVLAAYGVRDYFQLIERVSGQFLNSNVNSIRQRVQAQAGSRVIQWIADRAPVLASPTPPAAGVFLEDVLTSNVEKWLAVTGTQDSTIAQYSEPVAVPAQPTIPTMTLASVPDALKGVLDGVGVDGVLPQA